SAYEWPLNSLGPFTVLVPTNPGFKGINIKDLLSNKESAQYFVKLHIFAGQLDLNGLNHMTTIHTLTGKPADVINDEKDKMLRIRIQGGKKKGKILQADIVASNGVMHIVDEALDNVEPSFPSDEENTLAEVMLDIHPGPYTIFVPTNEALESLNDGSLDYLLSS
ncbi:Stabilin-2, partial [Varanus komodoensis]